VGGGGGVYNESCLVNFILVHISLMQLKLCMKLKSSLPVLKKFVLGTK
jgi:hypothetical protein